MMAAASVAVAVGFAEMAAVVAMAKEEKVGGCAVSAAAGNMVVTVARDWEGSLGVPGRGGGGPNLI